MKKIIIFTLTIVAALFNIVNSQIIPEEQKNQNNHVTDDVLGISFVKVGTVVQLDSSTYSINLLSSDGSPVQSAIAQVSVSSRLFIDLPGSYGGRVYLNSPSAAKLLSNRVMVDSVNTGNQSFCREYWEVYAGMGMWDCVINCYEKEKGKYYVVSLIQDKPIGKPGEIVNGKKLTAEDLKLKAVSTLQDTTNTIVKKFNQLLFSFQVRN